MHGRHVSGESLRDIRERQGLFRAELARRSGVSLAWIKYIELDGRQPSGIVVYKLAKALKVDIDAFTTSAKRAA